MGPGLLGGTRPHPFCLACLRAGARQLGFDAHSYEMRPRFSVSGRGALLMQPLSNIPNVQQVSFVLGPDTGNNPFEQRPKLAPFCIDAIAAASQVEASLLQLFMQLMGGSYQVSAKMYLALIDPARAVLKASWMAP